MAIEESESSPSARVRNNHRAHEKTDGRPAHNPVKVALGGAIHAMLCRAGHNIRLMLKKSWLLFDLIMAAIRGMYTVSYGHQFLTAR